MPKVISVHQYKLKPDVEPQAFEQAYRQAKTDGLFNLPGLVESYLIKGIRGERGGEYASIWIYKSQESWERLWGGVGSPLSPSDYPPAWLTWENEILAQFLDEPADEISFTSYLCVE
ncbi:MAG: hypothetical protein PVF74_00480 [Anaerolineales bacterium]|jgi:hypothetical protein